MPKISPSRQKEIDDVIERIQLGLGLSYPEDGLLELSQALRLDVLEVDFNIFDLPPEKKGSEISGVIVWGDKTTKDSLATIYINKKYSSNRKTFTTAHEIGHYLLHPNEAKFRLDVVDYSLPESASETEANYFAASLLVPKEKLLQLMKLTSDLKAIADHFAVSEPVIEKRIKWMESNYQM